MHQTFFTVQVKRPVQNDWVTMVIDNSEAECRRLFRIYTADNPHKKIYRIVRCEVICTTE